MLWGVDVKIKFIFMKRKNNIAVGFILGLVSIFCITQKSLSQNEDRTFWHVKGFVDTYHAVRIESPNDFLSSRTRVRGEVERQFGVSSLFVSFNAIYNAFLKEHTKFDLREAYLDHRAEHWGVRLGRQLVIWGAADGLRITDLVSPMDMSEFLAQDYDDIRMPVNALRFFTFNDGMKLEMVLVPNFQGYILPTDKNNPWCIFPRDVQFPFVWHDRESYPAFKISNIEYGGRLCFALPGIDFSIAGLHTWNKMPVLTYQPSAGEVVVSPHFYRMGFVGGDVSKPLGQFVLRAETAVNFSKHFSYLPQTISVPQKGFNTVNSLIGVDWYGPHEWLLMVQFSNEHIFKYENQIAQPRNTSLLTLNISKKLLESTLQLSDFTYYDLNHQGWFSRFAADYSLNDHIHLILGFDWFEGDKGMFSLYKRNSGVWVKAKYGF